MNVYAHGLWSDHDTTVVLNTNACEMSSASLAHGARGIKNGIKSIQNTTMMAGTKRSNKFTLHSTMLSIKERSEVHAE